MTPCCAASPCNTRRVLHVLMGALLQFDITDRVWLRGACCAAVA